MGVEKWSVDPMADLFAYISSHDTRILNKKGEREGRDSSEDD